VYRVVAEFQTCQTSNWLVSSNSIHVKCRWDVLFNGIKLCTQFSQTSRIGTLPTRSIKLDFQSRLIPVNTVQKLLVFWGGRTILSWTTDNCFSAFARSRLNLSSSGFSTRTSFSFSLLSTTAFSSVAGGGAVAATASVAAIGGGGQRREREVSLFSGRGLG
jgi:hypothetical protein